MAVRMTIEKLLKWSTLVVRIASRLANTVVL